MSDDQIPDIAQRFLDGLANLNADELIGHLAYLLAHKQTTDPTIYKALRQTLTLRLSVQVMKEVT